VAQVIYTQEHLAQTLKEELVEL
jgi:hypothetical protein